MRVDKEFRREIGSDRVQSEETGAAINVCVKMAAERTPEGNKYGGGRARW